MGYVLYSTTTFLLNTYIPPSVDTVKNKFRCHEFIPIENFKKLGDSP